MNQHLSTYCVSGARLWGCSRLSTLCSRVAVVGRGMWWGEPRYRGRVGGVQRAMGHVSQERVRE